MNAPRDAAVDVSVLVNTFEKPGHLALVLESIALQRGADCRLEVIVSDDGSTDGTAAVVAAFAAHAGFPVRFTTQPHDGFRLARVRNAAARLARGDYLLFLDGDCLMPPHHVAAHLARRRRGTALLGYCARLPRGTSELLVPASTARSPAGGGRPGGTRPCGIRRSRGWPAATSASGGATSRGSTGSTSGSSAGARRMTTWACGCGRPACGWSRSSTAPARCTSGIRPMRPPRHGGATAPT
jgi:hypothetical protein